MALQQINAAAVGLDQRTITLQYFDTLKTLGGSAATKYIFPLEFTGLISEFVKGRG